MLVSIMTVRNKNIFQSESAGTKKKRRIQVRIIAESNCVQSTHPFSSKIKNSGFNAVLDWRRDRDLNPGYVSVHSRSKTARSTTLTSLHINFVFGNV